uniref:Lipocalin/cytosolic fatty-acid binding domain-containing protein n=1 Tax=Coptotermes formosanus TaxID=36987 RepID=R4UNX6_COPFO|nr:hypothetical protein [Coptotermes formosanus]
MHLIIILGLIAKLALVSGDCEGGNGVSNFDYNKFTGTWSVVYHEADDGEDKLDCAYLSAYRLRNGSRIVSLYYYHDSIKGSVERIAIVPHIDNTGFDLDVLDPSIWNGRVQFAAVDYKRFYVAKFNATELRSVRVYVGYRDRHPDEATLNDAKKALSDNGIDFDTLKSWNSSRCDHFNYKPNRSLEL